jgi:hypothetical protein
LEQVEQVEQIFGLLLFNLDMLGEMLPKLYQVAHPKCPHLVVFIGPDGKRVRRQFKHKAEAVAYHRELLAKAKMVGTVGLVMDSEMRAEYFGAIKALDGVPLLSAVNYYLRHKPTGQGSIPLSEVLKTFLQDKRRSGRADRTVESLKSAVELFLVSTDACIAADYSREQITRYLDSLRFHPLTLRTHRARLSSFGEWMAKRQYIPENPTRYIDVGHYDLSWPQYHRKGSRAPARRA